MTKIKIKCKHCDAEIDWYESAIDETDYKAIGDKFYCNECLRLLTRKFIG